MRDGKGGNGVDVFDERCRLLSLLGVWELYLLSFSPIGIQHGVMESILAKMIVLWRRM